MVISAGDYRERFVKTKMVKLEEGIEFEIRRISPLDMWTGKKTSVEEQGIEFMRVIISKGVVNPPISLEEKEGCIYIKDLIAEHLNKLTAEIMEFSGLKTEGEGFLSQEDKPSPLIQSVKDTENSQAKSSKQKS